MPTRVAGRLFPLYVAQRLRVPGRACEQAFCACRPQLCMPVSMLKCRKVPRTPATDGAPFEADYLTVERTKICRG